MTLNANQSYERKPGGANGNGLDTNDNASDFFLNASITNPTGLAGTCLTATPARGATWGRLKTIYR
jgi:hypothetical protein